MFLAIDIGNSSIKFGLYEDDILKNKFSIPTKENLSTKKLTAKWEHFIGSRNVRIGSALASSVVPEANEFITEFCKVLFEIDLIFIDSTMFGGLNSRYEPPNSVGHDRLVNVYAAIHKYGNPVIVCSFGTATTIDTADAEGTYLGGIITPGMRTMAESLNLKTSQLPVIDIRPATRVIGNSTERSILSGVYFGHAGLAEKLIERFSDEIISNDHSENKLRPFVVATGGLANMLAPIINNIDKVDDNLTLDGLNLINLSI